MLRVSQRLSSVSAVARGSEEIFAREISRAERGKRDLVTKAAPRFALLSEKAAIPIVKDVPPHCHTAVASIYNSPDL